MGLSQLTDQEAKTIYLLHKKLNYQNPTQVKEVCEILRKKKLLRSEPACEYENNLNMLELDSTLRNDQCIFCENPLQQEENLICEKCLEEIKKRLEIVTKTDKLQESSDETIESEPDKQFRIRWPAVILAGALLLIIISLGMVAWFKNSESKADQSLREKQFVSAYSENLDKQDYKLGKGQPYDENSTLYPILSGSEQTAHNSMITFYDESKILEGVGLQMNGNDQESRVQQLALMSMVGVTMYEDMSIEQAGKLLEQMLNQNGILDYKGYRWVMTADKTGSSFLMIDEDVAGEFSEIEQEGELSSDQTKTGDEQTADSSQQLKTTFDLDLLNLLGNPYEQAEAILGTSEAVVTENTRYFPESCISVIYDTQSKEVIYIDCDGLGDRIYTLCGVGYGDSRDDIVKRLTASGLKEPESDTGDTLVYQFRMDEQNVELSITFINDTASLICCKIL